MHQFAYQFTISPSVTRASVMACQVGGSECFIGVFDQGAQFRVFFCSGGEMIDRSLMSTLTRMLSSLSLYTMFEVPFLQESDEFYQAEGITNMDTMDVRGIACPVCVA